MKSNNRNIVTSRRKVPLFTTLCTLCFLLLFVLLSQATHQVEHRFTVFGKVRLATSFPGKPLPNKEIKIVATETKAILAVATTDENGGYSVILHVHNQALGMKVEISSSGAQETLELKFDPSDMSIERKELVDLLVFPKAGD